MSLGFSCCFLSRAASNCYPFLAPNFTDTWAPIAARSSCQLLASSAFRWCPHFLQPFSTHSNVHFADKWSSLPVVAGFTWTPISGHCLTRSAVSAHAQASLATSTASDSEFPATCEHLQLPSVRLCTPGVLCPAMVHRDGQTHTSLSSAADLT